MDDLFRLDAESQAKAQQKAENCKQPEDAIILRNLSPDFIRAFRNHPFHLYAGERLDDLVSSIKANGILTPVIIRTIEKDEDGYEFEMLAGHNRQNAARLAGLTEIPCIVKENITDEEAWIYVVETNVLQRSFTDMLPSEKATILALRYSKMFSQGKRNDIIEELKRLENPQYIKDNSTSPLIGTRLRSDEKLGNEYGLARNTVARLLRVDKLAFSLKNRVDTGEIGIYPAVEISYLSENEQQMVESVLSENEYKLDMKKAELLRDMSGRLNDELTEQIISGEKTKKPKSSTPPPVKIKATVYSKYFAKDTRPSEIEKVVDEALALYFSQKDGKEESA
jgi:ParB family chromosome partitioning protein